jgi:argininosuccinate lyase
MLDQAARETAGMELGFADQAVRDALDPRCFVETRVTDGSVAPQQVERLLAQAQAELAADRLWMEKTRGRLAHAQNQLDRAVGRLAVAAEAA